MATVAVLTLAVAACGSSSSKAASTTPATNIPASTTTTTVPAATTTTPTAPATTAAPTTTVPATTTTLGLVGCSTSQLSLSISNAEGTAGSTYENLNFVNSSQTPCTVSGYPGVSFVTGASGTQVGAPATRNASSTPVTLTLSPGLAATSQLQIVDAENFPAATCQLTPVLGFRVYPPNQTAAAFVAAAGQACASTSVQGLTVGALTPG